MQRCGAGHCIGVLPGDTDVFLQGGCHLVFFFEQFSQLQRGARREFAVRKIRLRQVKLQLGFLNAIGVQQSNSALIAGACRERVSGLGLVDNLIIRIGQFVLAGRKAGIAGLDACGHTVRRIGAFGGRLFKGHGGFLVARLFPETPPVAGEGPGLQRELLGDV